MPDQQYFMVPLRSLAGSRLVVSAQEEGSVSIDPHKALRHRTRRLRRGAGGRPEWGVAPAGLMYAVWTLPVERIKWNLERARAYASTHHLDAEVHTVASSHTWKSTMTAVHPSNPILFEE